jgi:hypothetical protein
VPGIRAPAAVVCWEEADSLPTNAGTLGKGFSSPGLSVAHPGRAPSKNIPQRIETGTGCFKAFFISSFPTLAIQAWREISKSGRTDAFLAYRLGRFGIFNNIHKPGSSSLCCLVPALL